MTDNSLNSTEQIQAILATEATLAANNATEILREELASVRQMLSIDNANWTRLLGGNSHEDTTGMSLDQLKEHAELIRTRVAGGTLLGRARDLRHQYVWAKGLNIVGADEATKRRTGPKSKNPKTSVAEFVNNPVNQASLFSSDAQFEMETSAVTDGMFLLIGDSVTKTVRPIPVTEIVAYRTNPDFVGEIWSYLREWDSDVDGKITRKSKWYYVDTHTGDKRKSLQFSGKAVPVSSTEVIIDQRFNTQTGWALGIPDALSAVPWSEMYVEVMVNGKIMTDALAQFAHKVTVQGQTGANTARAKISGAKTAGQTAVMGQGNDLVSLASAGRSYDFGGARPLASLVASSMNVSVVNLLADPGAAGSSYGSAQTLTPSEVRSGVMRQKTWVEYIRRVLLWATGDNVEVSFPPIEDSDKYREAQVETLFWNQGLLHPEEARAVALKLTGIMPIKDEAPEGILIPNTSGTNDILNPVAEPSDDEGNGVAAAAPDQGKSNGTGGNPDKASDTRRDVQTNESLLNNMMLTSLTDDVQKLTSIVEQLMAKVNN